MLTQLVLSFVDLCACLKAATSPQLPSVDVLRDVTGFGRWTRRALPVIPAACAEWDSFQGNLCPVLRRMPIAAQRDQRSAQYEWATAKLFDLFDANGDGTVDFSLASTLALAAAHAMAKCAPFLTSLIATATASSQGRK